MPVPQGAPLCVPSNVKKEEVGPAQMCDKTDVQRVFTLQFSQ